MDSHGVVPFTGYLCFQFAKGVLFFSQNKIAESHFEQMNHEVPLSIYLRLSTV